MFQTTAAADMDPDDDIPEYDSWPWMEQCRVENVGGLYHVAWDRRVMTHASQNACWKLQQVSLRLGLLPPLRNLVNYSVVTFCT